MRFGAVESQYADDLFSSDHRYRENGSDPFSAHGIRILDAWIVVGIFDVNGLAVQHLGDTLVCIQRAFIQIGLAQAKRGNLFEIVTLLVDQSQTTSFDSQRVNSAVNQRIKGLLQVAGRENRLGCFKKESEIFVCICLDHEPVPPLGKKQHSHLFNYR